METPRVVQTLGDGSEADVVAGVWKHPAIVTEPMILEYRRWLEALRKCDGTAQDGRIRVWLSKLLFGLSGNHSEEMIRAKLGAFAFALADKPSFCFDDAVLRRAQKHFKSFWPSAGELIEFMETVEAEVRVKAERAWKVVDGGPRAAGAPPTRRAWAEGGAEDNARWNRERADRERRELVEILRRRDEEAGRVAPASASEFERRPGESDAVWMDRLRDLRNENIDLGARARRADEVRYRRGRELEEAEKRAAARPVKRAASPPPSPDAMAAAYAETGLDPNAWRTKHDESGEVADAHSPGA